MEFKVGYRPRRSAHGLARHAQNEAEQTLGPGIVPDDFLTLRVESRARDFDYPSIISAAIQSETAQPSTVQHRLRWLRVFAVLNLLGETANGRMIFQVHGSGSCDVGTGLEKKRS